MPWYLYALGGAIIWGIHYNLLAKALNVMSPVTTYWLPTIVCMLGLPWIWDTLKADFKAAAASDPLTLFACCAILFTNLAASFLTLKGIQYSNAVHAGIIGVTYPLFLVLAAWLLFKESHFDWGTLLGGSLIVIGAGVVIYTQGQ